MKAPLGQIQKEAFGQLLISHALLTRFIDSQLQAEGYPSLLAYDVLLALEDAPDGRLRMCDLAQRMVFSPSGLTRLTDRLEKLGWVRREAHEKDRRSLYAVLTEAGLAARTRSWPRYSELIEEHFGQYLTPDEARVLRDALSKTIPKVRASKGSPGARMNCQE